MWLHVSGSCVVIEIDMHSAYRILYIYIYDIETVKIAKLCVG